MNDSEIEAALRNSRPQDPPASLRERILSQGSSQPVWPWATAAAVLLVSALTLRAAAQREAVRVDLGADPSATTIATLTDALGGDAPARELAESMVFEAQLRSEMAPPARDPEGEQP